MRRRRVLHERLGDPLAAVPDDDHDPPDVDLGHGVEHVQDHRPATQEVQRLRALGAHARALAGGQDDGGEAAAFGHRRILSPPGRPACVWDTAGVPELIPYDEFGLFHENAAEYGLPYDGPPDVRRVDGRGRSRPAGLEPALGRRHRAAPSWCSSTAGAQNAHTWDTVALALGRPLLAVDLPGHGHSDGGPDGSVSAGSQRARPRRGGRASWRPTARGVVGMSLGGVSSLALADHAPELVRALVLVDITPGVNAEKAAPITNFVNGPGQLRQLRRAPGPHHRAQPGPQRVLAAARHPAQRGPARGRQLGLALRPLPHRAARPRRAPRIRRPGGRPSPRLTVPVLLVRGLAWSVVDDEDVAELLRRQPTRARSSASRAPATASRATGRSSWPPSSPSSSTRRADGRGASGSRARALKLHAVLLIVVPAFMALCIWQVHRALGGNSLSWAYVFEWPLFAGYAVYMWWRIVHEAEEERPPPSTGAAAGRCRPDIGRSHGDLRTLPQPTPRPSAPDTEDAELTAYNEYLARLAERTGRRSLTGGGAPGGGLEPPTSGSKGRRSAD